MGFVDIPAASPDTTGLPEYRVTEVYTELDGNDVRMAFGTKRFGNVEWLYTVVISPEKLIKLCRHCELVACEAFNLGQLIDHATKGH